MLYEGELSNIILVFFCELDISCLVKLESIYSSECVVSLGSIAFLNLAMASCCLFGLAERPLNSSNCISYPFLGVREIAVLKSWTFWEAKSCTCGVTDAWAVTNENKS